MPSKVLPTVRIRNDEDGGTLIINARDFDKDKHVLAEEPVETEGLGAEEPLGEDETPTVSRPSALASPEAFTASNVEACIAAIATVGDVVGLDAIVAVETDEKTGKRRKTVLDAVERRRKALAAA